MDSKKEQGEEEIHDRKLRQEEGVRRGGVDGPDRLNYRGEERREVANLLIVSHHFSLFLIISHRLSSFLIVFHDALNELFVHCFTQYKLKHLSFAQLYNV